MCGISAIISKKNEAVELSEIKKINDLIEHRGPDGDGFYFGKNFAFGHRRLSIIDLSENGDQPMILDDEYIITYNGEVYNYLEIKEELKALAVQFKTQSDTEVILQAYKQWGESCVNKFNGMWAFSIFDKKKNILFCSRDRFGVKPFYYTKNDDYFVFGSEIKQLTSFNTSNKLNKSILADYLVYGFEEHQSLTFFENIYKLQPSNNLIYNLTNHEINVYPYYSLEASIQKIENDKSNTTIFSNLFKDAIKLRLRSDVKVGTCLSGGLDSSSIATIASKMYGENFIGINAKSIQKEIDESHHAKLVAENAKIDLHYVEPTTSDFYNALEKVIKIQEEPFGGPSIYMQYFVFEKAKELGCKVMLDGQGGDEMLLGYERYFPAYWYTLPFFSKISGIFKFRNNSRLTLFKVIAFLFYFTSYKLRDKLVKRKWSILKKDFVDLSNIEFVKESAKSYKNIKSLQVLEYTKLQLPHLLKYEDKNSMYNSIEARLPFLDYRLVELGIGLPVNKKINDGWSKFILRDAMRNILPESICWRKDKFGFESPDKYWLKDKEFIFEKINESNILKNIASNFAELNNLSDVQLWKFLNIAIWEKIYKIEY